MNFCSREIAAKSSTASLFTSVEMVNFWNAVCKMSSLNDLPVAALILENVGKTFENTGQATLNV